MKRNKLNKPILAEGEHTGHAHVAEGVDVYEGEGGVKEFDGATTVKHEEHNPITVPNGKWASAQVVEHDHFVDMERTVQD